jgi:hypothetical protein
MRAFILAGLFSLLGGLSSIAADTPPSDAVIQQRMVGTWIMNWHILTSFTTIATNGDYVRYDVSNSVHPETNWFAGKIEIKNGLWIDTLKKSSATNQPVPHVFTNVIIRLTDRELLFRAQDRSQPMMWERIKQ